MTTALRYDGTGPLFDAGETVCANHAGFADEYRPEHWEPCDDDGTCFICAEDRHIARAERMT
jgi:hypothetical protein